MEQRDKITVAVLFGGCSNEYEISLQSAASVITHLDRERFSPVLVGISREGQWFRYTGPVELIEKDQWQQKEYCTSAMISPDRGVHGLVEFDYGMADFRRIDVALPILHGKNGEDGTVQGLLELAGIPYAGCGVLSSAVCMDKDVAHQLVALAGVKVPAAVRLDRYGAEARKSTETGLSVQEQAELDRAAGSLRYPVYVKPSCGGSSLGIRRVESPALLPSAVAFAFEYDDKVIIEEEVPGFEVGCAVLGNGQLTIGQVDEIELGDKLFGFKEKYAQETTKIHMPARIDSQTAERIKEAAAKVYRALDCRGYARVDLFLTPEGEVVFNEVNSIPGFTTHSRFPSMLKGAGLSFGQIVSTLIDCALEDKGGSRAELAPGEGEWELAAEDGSALAEGGETALRSA